jgi:hypothetical protein
LKFSHSKQIKRTNVTASRFFLKTSPLCVNPVYLDGKK